MKQERMIVIGIGIVGAYVILRKAAPTSPLGKVAAALKIPSGPGPLLPRALGGGAGTLAGSSAPRALNPLGTNVATRNGTATAPLAPGIGGQIGAATTGIGSFLTGLSRLIGGSPASAPVATRPPTAAPSGGGSGGGGGALPNVSPSGRVPAAFTDGTDWSRVVGYDTNGNPVYNPSQAAFDNYGSLTAIGWNLVAGYTADGEPVFDASRAVYDASGQLTTAGWNQVVGYTADGNPTFDPGQAIYDATGTPIGAFEGASPEETAALLADGGAGEVIVDQGVGYGVYDESAYAVDQGAGSDVVDYGAGYGVIDTVTDQGAGYGVVDDSGYIVDPGAGYGVYDGGYDYGGGADYAENEFYDGF